LGPDGEVQGLVGITEDVTEVTDARHNATTAQSRLVDAIESIAGGFALFDENDRLVVRNTQFQRMFPELDGVLVPGIEWSELVRYSTRQFLTSDEREISGVATTFTLPKGHSGELSHEYRLRDGRWVRTVLYRTRGGGLVNLVFDISQEKRAEEARNLAQRLELIGKLAGGVAHDFNNLLTVIIGNAETLVSDAANLEDSRLARMVLEAGQRAGELTRRLLAFARKQPLEVNSLDCGQVVHGIEEILKRTLGGTIDVRISTQGDAWPVVADQALLESAIVNLAVNARDAMPKGGTLAIVTANTHLDSLYCETHPEVKPGDYVSISVADSGMGMTPEIKARATEPFFTTKERGRGTGMGLAIIDGFVKQAGGHLEIYSEPGHGTTVKLFLPRSMAVVPEGRRAREDGNGVPRGSERLLVVEDNDLVRNSVVRALSGLGYRVAEAADFDRAMDLLRGGEEVDLLFTDIMLPGQRSGFDLADQAVQAAPGLKILYTSGFVDDVVKHHGTLSLSLNTHLLTKPYSRRDLARKVRDVLNQAAS
jgi:signal transduction histidine kinase/CheY-like chemotaxis protein